MYIISVFILLLILCKKSISYVKKLYIAMVKNSIYNMRILIIRRLIWLIVSKMEHTVGYFYMIVKYKIIHLVCLLLYYVANSTRPNIQITMCLEEYPWYRSVMREMYRRCAIDATCTYTNGHITPFQEYRAIALCFSNIVTITRVAEMAPNATWDTNKFFALILRKLRHLNRSYVEIKW